MPRISRNSAREPIPGNSRPMSKKRAAKRRTVGEVVQEARKGLGLSQRALGKAAGIDASHVSHLENDPDRIPRFDTMARVAAALGMSLDDLAADCGYGAEPKGSRPLPRAAAELEHIGETLAKAQSLVDAMRKRADDER
jgi:transcriptional regulator with XRE-family HTH domain